MDFGHGFVPRIDVGNYKALDRVLGPRQLFDPVELDLAWVILDGAWVHGQSELLERLHKTGIPYLVDTSAWRFQADTAFDVRKLATMSHSPGEVWSPTELRDFGRFVAADLKHQASLGASAYLVPGLIPREKHEDLTGHDRDVAEIVKRVAMDVPRPAIATIGVHTLGMEAARRRLNELSGIYEGVYVQATPIHPYNDSVSKMAAVVDLLLEAKSQDRSVIAGRLGALTVPLRALGIDAADAGLAAGETFNLAGKLRRDPPREDGQPAPRTSMAARRYLPQIRRSLGPDRLGEIESVPAAEAQLRCTACCQYLAPDDRVRRGREHSLAARITEAVEISALPRSMRLERAEREWTAARRALTSVNRALTDAELAPLDGEYLDNQLALLRDVAARTKAA